MKFYIIWKEQNKEYNDDWNNNDNKSQTMFSDIAEA